MLPPKSSRRYEPRVFGFKVHAHAALARWQEEERVKMCRRLRDAGTDTGFEEEEEEEEEMEDDDAGLGEEEGIDDMFEGRLVQM